MIQVSSYFVLQSGQDRAVQSAVFKQGLPASTALSKRFSDWLNSRSHLLTRIPHAAKPSEPVFRLMSAFLEVSLRCLSAPSARGQSDASVPHELHTRNREVDVVHLWKATSRGPSVGACLGSKESVQSVTSRSRSSHVSAFPFHTCRFSQRDTFSDRPNQRD